MKRSVDLLAAVEEGEKKVLAEIDTGAVSEDRTRALLAEIVRTGVEQMIARLETSPAAGEAVERAREIEAEVAAVRTAQQGRDWSAATSLGQAAAVRAGFPEEALSSPAVARQVLSTMRRLLELERQVEAECDDPLHLGRELLAAHGLQSRRQALTAPMLLSEAIEKAAKEAPPEVEKKIRSVGRVALAYFGDVPVASLDRERVFEFLRLVWSLPKKWGTSHGRNRFGQAGREIDPVEEIRKADASDAEVLAAVIADDSLSLPDKRRLLVERLEPRLTDGYLIVQRDMVQRIFVAALGAKRVGRWADEEERPVPSHKKLKQRMIVWRKEARTASGLPTRVSRPKRRRSWSIEHIVKLLMSPLYQGSATKDRRWRKGTARARVIVRDALYWAPLFMMTMGLRPEEILQLKVKDVILRDGILCLILGEDGDDAMKTASSRRVLPIPEVLLKLGFREWIRAKAGQGDVWAFPEIGPDESHNRRSQIFGNRLRTLLDKLKLKCPQEDVYAMRRTLSSKLMQAGAETGTRQRILGHLEGATVDRHYSDHGLPELKAILDSVDYGIEIGRVRGFDFPVITGCATPVLPSLFVEVALAKDGAVSALRISDPDTEEVVLEASVEGSSAPAGDDWSGARPLAAKEIANRVLSLSRMHALTMPASEEAAAAIEHLLILGDLPAPVRSVSSPAPTATPVEEGSLAPVHEPTASADTAAGEPAPCADALDAGALRIGDTAICVFPLSRTGGEAAPRPALVVNVRTMRGRRYLDIARGGPWQGGSPAPHQVVVRNPDSTSVARLSGPTCFDLRRRILVAEDDRTRIHRRLGTLDALGRKRMEEARLLSGDVSPDPVGELPERRTDVVVVRRKRREIAQR